MHEKCYDTDVEVTESEDTFPEDADAGDYKSSFEDEVDHHEMSSWCMCDTCSDPALWYYPKEQVDFLRSEGLDCCSISQIWYKPGGRISYGKAVGVVFENIEED